VELTARTKFTSWMGILPSQGKLFLFVVASPHLFFLFRFVGPWGSSNDTNADRQSALRTGEREGLIARSASFVLYVSELLELK
jgi:hypothetical protein